MKTYVTRAAFVIGAVLLLALPFRGVAETQGNYAIAPQFQAVYSSGGGLTAFGYPSSDPMTINGLLVQYFERARFEYHPELAGTPYDVQLARVGADEAESRGLLDTPSFQPLPIGGSDGNCVFFAATGHRLCSGFREFWQHHGLDLGDAGISTRESLALFGYPISEEFLDPATGFTVQYFERARFEYHPELAGTSNAVSLGLLGNAQYERLKGGGGKKQMPTPTSTQTTTSSQQSAAQDSDVSIQSLVNAAAPGATVTVPAGIYRETVTINKPITLVGEPGAEIRGSDVWNTGWTKSGNYWVRGTLPSIPHGTWPCASGSNGRCDWPEQVFIDGNPLYQVASNPVSGQFAVNSRQIVLADDPSGHLVEVTTRQFWIVGGADNVTIQGFTMRQAATPGQLGAISNGGYSNWIIRGNALSDAHGAVVLLQGGAGLQVLNNDIGEGGEEGIAVDAVDGAVISGNSIHGNNTEQFQQSWEAGGLKATHASDVMVDSNTVSGNDGGGIWFDMNSKDVTVSNNRVHDNTRAGISYEISTAGRISQNAVWENAWGSPDTWTSSGILLDDSDNTEVSGNIVAWNVKGITVIAQSRPDRTRVIANVTVRDNTIAETEDYSPNARYALRWIDDGIAMLYNPSNHNTGSSNRYWYPVGEDGTNRFEWSQMLSELDAFNATQGEEGGLYISGAAKNSALSAAGVPVSPIAR